VAKLCSYFLVFSIASSSSHWANKKRGSCWVRDQTN